MHIAIFSRATSFHRSDADNFSFENLGSKLSSRGHDVSVLTTSHSNNTSEQELEDMTVHFLHGTKPEEYTRSFWKRSGQKFDEIHSKNSVDVVYSNSEGAYGFLSDSEFSDEIPLIHSKHNTLSTIFKFHSSNPSYKSRLTGYVNIVLNQLPFFWRVHRPLLEKATRVICDSHSVKEHVVSDYPSVKSKIEVIYNGVDVDKFRDIDASALQKKYELESGQQCILYVGRLSPEKGVDVLLRSIKYLDKSPTVIIVGDGNQRNKLEKVANSEKCGSDIIFTGQVDHELVPKYYTLADLTVLPSYYDSLPFTLLESLAAGTPVVATNVGGVPEIVNHGETGYVVPPGDHQSLGKYINRLLDNSNIRKEFNAQVAVKEKFTMEDMVNATEEILLEVT